MSPWPMLEGTPEGRGIDWYRKLGYGWGRVEPAAKLKIFSSSGRQPDCRPHELSQALDGVLMLFDWSQLAIGTG
ncbi:hypothetical protein LPW26_17040 [Rhodopseudomonas sp. HC1]|uniref:hypothetical protein n=1 Tax=Rhodopseudomonas infernalis TaxID=2897386 RepID=UPI001EE983E3|nr:hypothetical protein [Rhodopseudomonas infernalis]MCG6206357.1 hypothetical protein [Rhodopseudomonas infernalis]